MENIRTIAARNDWKVLERQDGSIVLSRSDMSLAPVAAGKTEEETAEKLLDFIRDFDVQARAADIYNSDGNTKSLLSCLDEAEYENDALVRLGWDLLHLKSAWRKENG